MAFNSLEFLVFFPVVLVGYFLLPARARWLWLLLASLYFYGVWEPLPLLQLIAATGLSYYLGLKIEAAPEKPRKKQLLKIGVLLLVANLALFKYTSFVNETFRSIFGWVGASYPIPVVKLLLPIGISFYTFQLISYLVDVSNGAKAERHAGIFALYTAFFPKLVAGPIERAKSLLPQLHTPQRFDYRDVAFGLQLMVWGAFKKLVVGDRLAPFVTQVYDDPRAHDGVAMTLATWLFAFQVYCDFSGYTDIAIGAAQTMGYKLTNNFNRPYFAISIADFWKRWHITLSTWLTDYLYTPITRTRRIKMKLYYLMMVSLLITFLISGLWHGAAWTFVVWGALHGSYMVCSMLTQKWRRKAILAFKLDRAPRLHHALRVAFTFSLVSFAYIFFQASSIADALYIVAHLPTGWGNAAQGVKEFMAGHWAEGAFAAYGVAVVMVVDMLQAQGSVRDKLAKRPAWMRWGVYYAGAVSIVLLGAFYDTNQKFIYFQF